jgi:CBS domain-containing protein
MTPSSARIARDGPGDRRDADRIPPVAAQQGVSEGENRRIHSHRTKERLIPMTTARDIMSGNAKCIGEHQTLSEAAQMMRDLDVGALPICGDDNRLQGIITDRDIVLKCVAEGRDPATCLAGELAQGKPRTVRDDADVNAVLKMMEQHRIRRMPVISHNGSHQLVGMISEADVARHASPEQLAEFVATNTAR